MLKRNKVLFTWNKLFLINASELLTIIAVLIEFGCTNLGK